MQSNNLRKSNQSWQIVHKPSAQKSRYHDKSLEKLSAEVHGKLNEIIEHFNNLIEQTRAEFSQHLDQRYPNIEFLKPFASSTHGFESELTLARAICHCYPVLYGLRINTENSYQQALQQYLISPKNTAPFPHSQLEIHNARAVFQTLVKAKQAMQTFREEISHFHDVHRLRRHMTALVSTHVITPCKQLIAILKKTDTLNQQYHPEARNIIPGLINQNRGFQALMKNYFSQ